MTLMPCLSMSGGTASTGKPTTISCFTLACGALLYLGSCNLHCFHCYRCCRCYHCSRCCPAGAGRMVNKFWSKTATYSPEILSPTQVCLTVLETHVAAAAAAAEARPISSIQANNASPDTLTRPSLYLRCSHCHHRCHCHRCCRCLHHCRCHHHCHCRRRYRCLHRCRLRYPAHVTNMKMLLRGLLCWRSVALGLTANSRHLWPEPQASISDYGNGSTPACSFAQMSWHTYTQESGIP